MTMKPALTAAPDFIKLDDAGNELPSDAGTWSQVLDHAANLIWTADNAIAERLTWKKAKDAVAACRVGNATDWRLPTVKELVGIVDHERADPAIDMNFFRCKPNWYWTASPCAWAPGSGAWFVSFLNGYVYYLAQSYPAFVRAVRSASVPGQ